MTRYTVWEWDFGDGSMKVRILFFGVLRDLAGRNQDELDLPSGSSVADVLAHCKAKFTGLEEMLPSVAIAVNQQYSRPDTKLNDRDEVALLPPVSGGALL